MQAVKNHANEPEFNKGDWLFNLTDSQRLPRPSLLEGLERLCQFIHMWDTNLIHSSLHYDATSLLLPSNFNSKQNLLPGVYPWQQSRCWHETFFLSPAMFGIAFVTRIPVTFRTIRVRRLRLRLLHNWSICAAIALSIFLHSLRGFVVTWFLSNSQLT